MGEIVWLCRYPVKSMLGEKLPSADLSEAGVVGDRRYALVDRKTGLVASAKNPARWSALLTMSARYRTQDQIEVRLPNGTLVRGEDPDVDEELSHVVGRAVCLTRARPEGATLERLAPETEPAAGELTRGHLGAGTPGDTFVDFAPVHIVTTQTLDALARDHRGEMDVRRFRPNVVVRLFDSRPFTENQWSGLNSCAGLGLRVIVPTPRCVVPTLAHGEDVPADPAVIRTAARLNRTLVEGLGLRTCVGAYAAVTRPGPLRLGEVVSLSEQDPHAQDPTPR
jgi:uncharacterized protein